jgi:hypothetical protein
VFIVVNLVALTALSGVPTLKVATIAHTKSFSYRRDLKADSRLSLHLFEGMLKARCMT